MFNSSFPSGLHGAEHAGSMEQREMEERNSRYRCLKMKAAAAWVLDVLLSLLSVFGGEVPYVNEIQMSLAALVLLFPGNAFYAWSSLISSIFVDKVF